SDDCVDARGLLQQLVDIFLHIVARPGRFQVVVFHQRHPERARLLVDGDVWKELRDFDSVRFGPDRAWRCEDDDMCRLGVAANTFGGGADDAEQLAQVAIARQVVLWKGPEGFGGRCIAGEDYQVASQFEQLLDAFFRVGVDGFERARAIGYTGVVAQIYIIILRELLDDFSKNRQAAISGIKHAYRVHFRGG